MHKIASSQKKVNHRRQRERRRREKKKRLKMEDFVANSLFLEGERNAKLYNLCNLRKKIKFASKGYSFTSTRVARGDGCRGRHGHTVPMGPPNMVAAPIRGLQDHPITGWSPHLPAGTGHTAGGRHQSSQLDQLLRHRPQGP